jgi:hypothetical protein
MMVMCVWSVRLRFSGDGEKVLLCVCVCRDVYIHTASCVVTLFPVWMYGGENVV